MRPGHPGAMTHIRHIAILAAAATAALPASSAFARGGNDDRVIRTGHCSDGSTWKLKVKPDDGRLEAELEVDQNRNGVRWDVVLRSGGKVAATGTRTTKAPSGSFSFERRIAGSKGTKVTATAKRSGETCRAAATA